MERRYGATKRDDVLIQIGRNRWELVYGFGTDGVRSWSYRERFSRKPSIDDIKSIITEQINSNTEEKITSGFKWNDIPVWLSLENQLNYLSAYTTAKSKYEYQPYQFKFGSEENPVYYEFATFEELENFYKAFNTYIKNCVSDGWREKNNLNLDKIRVIEYNRSENGCN